MRKNQRMNIAVLPEGTEDDVKRLPGVDLFLFRHVTSHVIGTNISIPGIRYKVHVGINDYI